MSARRRYPDWRLALRAVMMLLLMAAQDPARAYTGSGTEFCVALAVLAHRARQASRVPPASWQRAKLRSGLGLIGFLGRAYCARRRCHGRQLNHTFRALRPLFRAHQYGALAARLAVLSARYPVPMAGLWPLPDSRGRWRRGRFLYRRLCAGCHTAAVTGGAVPDLFAMARHEGPRLLMIRILGGVRGTRRTALGNPLTRAQVASLALYLVTPARPPSRRPRPAPGLRR